MPTDRQEEADQHRDCDDDQPGTRRELRLDDEREDESGRERPDPVQDGAPSPAGRPESVPAANHPSLREREGSEHADHVQVNEGEDVRVVDPDEERGGRREDDDPVGVDESVAQVHELTGEVAVAREHRGQAREALV